MSDRVENKDYVELPDLPLTDNTEGFVAIGYDADSGNETKVLPMNNIATKADIDKLSREKLNISSYNTDKQGIDNKIKEIEDKANKLEKDKQGYKSTIAKLKADHPNPESGWYAYVGETGTIWEVSNGEWVDSKKPIPEELLQLEGYAKKTELDEKTDSGGTNTTTKEIEDKQKEIIHVLPTSSGSSNITINISKDELENGSIAADGLNSSNSTIRLRTINYLNISKIEMFKITISPEYQFLIRHYDALKKIIINDSTWQSNDYIENNTILNASYIRLIIRKSDESDIVPIDLGLNISSIESDGFVPVAPLGLVNNIANVLPIVTGNVVTPITPFEQGGISVNGTNAPDNKSDVIRSIDYYNIGGSCKITINDLYKFQLRFYDANKNNISVTPEWLSSGTYQNTIGASYIRFAVSLIAGGDILPSSNIGLSLISEVDTGEFAEVASVQDLEKLKEQIQSSGDYGTISNYTINKLPIQSIDKELRLSEVKLIKERLSFPTTAKGRDTSIGANDALTIHLIDDSYTHSSVLYMAGGWNGYEYWCALTPYWGKTYEYDDVSQFENPHIFCSNDGINWFEPTGIANPLVRPTESATKGKYWSDTHLTLGADGYLYCFIRGYKLDLHTMNETSGTHARSVGYLRSLDGINWSPFKLVYSSDTATSENIELLSPCFINTDGYWHVFDVLKGINPTTTSGLNQYNNNFISHRRSQSLDKNNELSDYSSNFLVNFVEPLRPTSLYSWHIDACKWGNAWFILNNYSSDTGNSGIKGLFLQYSTDGRNFKRVYDPIFNTGTYRSSLVPKWFTDQEICFWVYKNNTQTGIIDLYEVTFKIE